MEQLAETHAAALDERPAWSVTQVCACWAAFCTRDLGGKRTSVMLDTCCVRWHVGTQPGLLLEDKERLQRLVVSGMMRNLETAGSAGSAR